MTISKRLGFGLVSLLCISVTWFCQMPKIFNQYVFSEDLRSNIYWMERARDPMMFHNDLLADFNSAFSNPILTWLYRSASPIDLKLLSELLAFPLCWIAVFFIFRLGDKLGGVFCAVLASILLILASWHETAFDYFGVGNAGDFVLPLTTAFLYFFYVDNLIGISLVLLLQAVFYPPIYLICMSCFALSALPHFHVKRMSGVVIVSIISLGILFSTASTHEGMFGKVYSGHELRSMEEFKSAGRMPLFRTTPVEQLFNTRSGIGRLEGSQGGLFVIALIALTLAIFLRRSPGLPARVLLFLAVSVLYWLAANIYMLKLFEPSRYMLFSLPVCSILYIARLFSDAIESCARGRLRTLLLTVAILTPFACLPIRPQYHVVTEVNLFKFIKSLPPDCMIAGDPYLVDDIPLVARRKVFLSSESSRPLYKGYNREIQRRTFEQFEAYYSHSYDEFLDFARRNKIDYFILSKENFSESYLSGGNYYYQPYNDYIHQLISKRGVFALQNVPRTSIVYEDPRFLVIDVRAPHG